MAPTQKPHRSKQDYATPPEFLAAVTRRFGPLTWDLAATADNSVARSHYFGPGSRHGEDALAVSWANVSERGGWLWLNPPFADIDPWARKCVEEMLAGRARILLLTPASVGSRWFARHVQPHAHVIGLSPRITFVGEAAGYPKDLSLSVFAHGLTGFSTWQWAPARARRDRRAA